MHTGGLVNVVTRSGTNTYHGSAFEFIRNNYHRTAYQLLLPLQPKDTLHQNQYGGTFGGPILRDKLFAFAGYQRSESKQSQPATKATVPTAANLAGDFSVTDGPTCTSSKKFIQLFDPLTGAKLTNDKYPTPPTYNAQALKLQKYLPAIDPTYDTGNCGFVSYSIPLQTATTSLSPASTTPSTRRTTSMPGTSSTAIRLRRSSLQPTFSSPPSPEISQRVQTFTLGEAYTISSRIVNTAHLTTDAAP